MQDLVGSTHSYEGGRKVNIDAGWSAEKLQKVRLSHRIPMHACMQPLPSELWPYARLRNDFFGMPLP